MEHHDKASLLAAFDLTRDLRAVELPDGRSVRIRPMTARGADAFERAAIQTPDLARAVLMQQSICGEDGQLIFGSSEVELLADMPRRSADPIIAAIREHNGLDQVYAAESVGK